MSADDHRDFGDETLEILLWVDDVRPAPRGWVWAKNIAHALAYLASGRVTHASLDHDMPGGDGTRLLRIMGQQGMWPSETCEVHSANPPAALRMRQLIAASGQYG